MQLPLRKRSKQLPKPYYTKKPPSGGFFTSDLGIEFQESACLTESQTQPD
ncbi:MAG: hypothetical protein CM15mP59_4860 [Flavobacteriaceae bacterium]|nr:MAG: hypothetical protein CM15mP59_4860 [Flavobacteriaceae bacterium]